jgi:uroporphyrin-III C-methyltransferase
MGHVIFIGAGPGAADLITVRGAQRLASADVVLFDALTDPALRIYAPKARWIDVGKRGFEHATAQADIDALLVQLAHEHAVVVRLKGGDPSLFGRLEEELQALQAAGIPCEVVPGVTAALAAAATAQRPLTRRGSGRSVSFSTAMTREGEVHTGHRADTEVFYMAGRQLAKLGRRLLRGGLAGRHTRVRGVTRRLARRTVFEPRPGATGRRPRCCTLAGPPWSPWVHARRHCRHAAPHKSPQLDQTQAFRTNPIDLKSQQGGRVQCRRRTA